MHPVSVITPFNHNQPNVTKSQQSFNTSTKSLVHSQKSPLLKPIPTRIQRNQSFHGFQGLPPPRFPFGQNFPNAPSFPNLPLGISNQIYQTNPFNSTSSIGPLILSQNSLTLKKSLDTIGQTNLAFSPPKNQYFQPLRFGPSSGAMNPFTPSKGVTHTPPRLPLFNISTFGKSQSNLTSGNLANGSNEGTPSTLKTSQETIAGSLGSSGEQTRVKRARSLKSSQSGSIATTTSNLKASENGYGLSNERLGEPQGNSRDQNQVKRAMSFVASQSGSIGGTPSTLKASQETIGGTRGGSGEQNRVKRARSFVSSQSGSIGGTPSCSQAFQNILKTPQERSENQNQPSPVNRTSSIGTNTLQTSQNAGEGFQIERSRSFSLPGDLEENEPPLGLHKKSRSIPGLVEEIPEVRKFGSLEYRPHKCNSPQFYSVRCKKHGKKRTIFELYTLGPNKSLQKGLQGPAGPPKHCVVVSQIPKTNSNPKDFKDDEIIYQNLTDSIQILEQNSENDYYEFLQKPKPAPRCKKHQNIYQNVSASIQNREFDLNDSTGEENRSNLSLENSAENSNQTLSTGKHFGNSLDTSDSTKKMFEGLKSPGLKDLSNTQKDSSPENSSGDIPSTGKCSGTPFNGSNLSGNGFETTGSPGFLELSCISSINTSGNPLEASGTSIDASLEEKSPNPEKKIKLSPIALEENSNSDQNVDNQKPQSTMQNFFEKGGVLRSTFSKKEASGTPKNLVRDVPENIPGDCQTQNLNSPKPCGNTGNGSNMVPIQKPPRLTLTQFFKTGSTKPFLKSSSNDNKGPERTLILTPKSPLPGPPSLGFFRTEGSARASFSAKNLRASQNKKNENEKNFKEEIGPPNNVHGIPNPNLGNQNLPDSPKILPGLENFAPKGAPISPKPVQSFPLKFSPNKNFQGFLGNQNFPPGSKNSLQEGTGSPKRVPIPPKPVQEFQQKFSPNKPFQGFSGTQNVVLGTQNLRSGTQNLRPGTQNVAPENQNLAPGAQNLTSATQKTVPGTQNFVSGTKNVAPGTLNLVPGTQNFVAGTQNLVQGIPKDTNLKYPVPIKPNLNPVPKNPNFENSQNFSNVPKIQGYQGTQGSSQPNAFYTLTPDIRQFSQNYPSQQFSTTLPNNRGKFLPKALFQENQNPGNFISKSKSFNSKAKNSKKNFQIPLQKCQSFRFQTAESYFQPIKNLHEENLMKNGGGIGSRNEFPGNFSRECQNRTREKQKVPSRHGPLILKRKEENFRGPDISRTFQEKSVKNDFPEQNYEGPDISRNYHEKFTKPDFPGNFQEIPGNFHEKSLKSDFSDRSYSDRSFQEKSVKSDFSDKKSIKSDFSDRISSKSDFSDKSSSKSDFSDRNSLRSDVSRSIHEKSTKSDFSSKSDSPRSNLNFHEKSAKTEKTAKSDFTDKNFHENVQNSVKLQYPQPLYSQKSNGIPGPLKNGVVYADLDLEEKFDEKNSKNMKNSPEKILQKKIQKAKTEYATLKFNEVGQEIDV